MANQTMEGVTITSIFQDEPANGLGDGETGPSDARLLGANRFKVRAERSGLGNGRACDVNSPRTTVAAAAAPAPQRSSFRTTRPTTR